MAKQTWEDRYLSVDIGKFDALKEFAKAAIGRAEELDDEDLADEIREKASDAQDALDNLQDSMNDLDDLEKEAGE